MRTERTAVALVGAGPIGLEMAAALAEAGIPYLHFERGQVGQTIHGYPPRTTFFSTAERIALGGVPLPLEQGSRATREQYLAYLRAFVGQFGLHVRTWEAVTAIGREAEGFRLRTETRAGPRRISEVVAEKLVLAVGDMHAPRRLGIPGEDLPTVRHVFPGPHPYFRRRLLVVGGGNSAVEAAILCHHAGVRVAVSYRGERFDAGRIKYWLHPEIEGLARRGEIDARFGTVPVRIRPGAVTLAPVAGGAPVEVAADFVLVQVGYEMNPALLRMAGVRLEGTAGAPALNEATMETTVPGCYVAGTATAGTQRDYRAFIETSHIHVRRILAHLTGAPPPEAPPPRADLES
jgi:thioredoxin reductase (NADPH)